MCSSAPTRAFGAATIKARPGAVWMPPRPGLGVWSLTPHPELPDTIFAGYEPCAILRSDDSGESWTELPIKPTYPAVSDHPDIPKRVISIAVDPGNVSQMYASIEVGGLFRSLDSGKIWRNIIDGLYIDEGFVDIHSVAISPTRPGQVTIATRSVLSEATTAATIGAI